MHIVFALIAFVVLFNVAVVAAGARWARLRARSEENHQRAWQSYAVSRQAQDVQHWQARD